MVPQEVIEHKIYLLRGKKVMLARDLAELYGVTTWNLNKAVNRNKDRFPDDFMFQLSNEEFHNFRNLIFQNGTSKRGGTRKPPCKPQPVYDGSGARRPHHSSVSPKSAGRSLAPWSTRITSNTAPATR